MRYQVMPIREWPKERTTNPQRSPFGVDRDTAIRELAAELDRIGATTFVLEIDIDGYWINQDGSLRKGARPTGPRIIVSATVDRGPLRMACDTYTDGVGNIRAIGLTLERLRAIDRYGVATKGEQYTGWLALPASGSQTNQVTAAWALLVEESEWGFPITEADRNRERLDTIHRKAVRRAHPDAGGSDDRLLRVNLAREAILADLYR